MQGCKTQSHRSQWNDAQMIDNIEHIKFPDLKIKDRCASAFFKKKHTTLAEIVKESPVNVLLMGDCRVPLFYDDDMDLGVRVALVQDDKKEIQAACSKPNIPHFRDITVTGYQVGYTLLALKNSLSDDTSSYAIPVQVFYHIIHKSVAMCDEKTKLEYAKGAILASHVGFAKSKWMMDTVMHSDFQADKSNFSKKRGQPMTFFMNLGPSKLNLEMGSRQNGTVILFPQLCCVPMSLINK